jgi:hypothetical protein
LGPGRERTTLGWEIEAEGSGATRRDDDGLAVLMGAVAGWQREDARMSDPTGREFDKDADRHAPHR